MIHHMLSTLTNLGGARQPFDDLCTARTTFDASLIQQISLQFSIVDALLKLTVVAKCAQRVWMDSRKVLVSSYTKLVVRRQRIAMTNARQ